MGFPKEAPEIAIQGFTNSPENDVLAEKRLRRAKTNVDNHNNNDFLAKMSHLNFGIRKQLISEVNCIFIPSQNVDFLPGEMLCWAVSGQEGLPRRWVSRLAGVNMERKFITGSD